MSEYTENEDGYIVDKEGNEPRKGTEQARINTLTKNWRTTERALEEANKKLDENQKAMQEMGQFVKGITDSVNDIKESKNNDSHNNEIDTINGQIDSLDEEIAAATKDEDWGKVATLNTKVRRLERKLIKLENKPVDEKKIVEKIKSEIKTDTNSVGNNVDVNLSINNFKNNTDWYGSDNKMTRYMDNIAYELAATGKYTDKSYSELLNDAKKETEKEFGYDKGASFNTVDGGSYGLNNNNTNINVNELTQDEKNMAFNMGISEKDFLKGKKLAAGGKK